MRRTRLFGLTLAAALVVLAVVAAGGNANQRAQEYVVLYADGGGGEAAGDDIRGGLANRRAPGPGDGQHRDQREAEEDGVLVEDDRDRVQDAQRDRDAIVRVRPAGHAPMDA